MQLISFKKYKSLEEDDNTIVEKAISGDKDAIELLINKHKEYLYKTAFLYLKDEYEATEICQETVYKAIISLHKLKQAKYFKTWITRILINNVRDSKRSKVKFVDKFEKIDLIDDISYEQLEEKIDLYNAIDILEEKFKTPIILQYFHDMTIKEIGEVLQCNENTVKTNLRRGRERLYKILKEGV
ncbi:sigma-70 family RNA polymerase sigma factor [Romboutsia weinsteinii]|nr:sigma-70 family RNA polymerase sigma factor [Romboutsia weinsteinii]